MSGQDITSEGSASEECKSNSCHAAETTTDHSEGPNQGTPSIEGDGIRRQKCDELNKEYQRRCDELNKEYQRRLEKLNRDHQQRCDRLIRDYQRRLCELNGEDQQKVPTELTEQTTELLDKMKRTHQQRQEENRKTEEEYEKLQQEYKDFKDKVTDEYNRMKQQLTDLQEENRTIKEKYEKLQQDCKDLQSRQEQNRETEEKYEKLQQEYKDFKGRINQRNTEYQQRVTDELQQQLTDMQEENRKTGLKYEKLQKEYMDFQERMRSSISDEMEGHSELSENLNNPCRQTAILKKYEILRLNHLPKVITLDVFVSDEARERIVSLVENTFDKACEDMKRKTDDLKRTFTDNEDKGNMNEMSKYIDVAIQNLQMALHCKDDSYYEDKIKILINEVPEKLTPFIAQWYKISCLMCLHKPILEPDWSKRRGQTDTAKKIFPPIKEESMKKMEEDSE